jgi:hypothetical protein
MRGSSVPLAHHGEQSDMAVQHSLRYAAQATLCKEIPADGLRTLAD